MINLIFAINNSRIEEKVNAHKTLYRCLNFECFSRVTYPFSGKLCGKRYFAVYVGNICSSRIQFTSKFAKIFTRQFFSSFFLLFFTIVYAFLRRC